MIYDFYTDVDNIVIWVGESKISFDTPNDVEDICALFENVIGDKIPNDSSQIEEFYEIVFFERKADFCYSNRTNDNHRWSRILH